MKMVEHVVAHFSQYKRGKIGRHVVVFCVSKHQYWFERRSNHLQLFKTRVRQKSLPVGNLLQLPELPVTVDCKLCFAAWVAEYA